MKVKEKIYKFMYVFGGIHKYAMLSLLGIVVIFVVNLVGVEFFSLKPQLTYFIATSINYIISYFGNIKVFNQSPSRHNLVKFIISSILFFILNNYLFYALIKYLNLHYLIAITINMIIFPLVKFLNLKYLVFNTSSGATAKLKSNE